MEHKPFDFEVADVRSDDVGGCLFEVNSTIPRKEFELSVLAAKAIEATDTFIEALRLIKHARDYCADHGVYPPEVPLGDAKDQYQSFDDWAADVAAKALAEVFPL